MRPKRSTDPPAGSRKALAITLNHDIVVAAAVYALSLKSLSSSGMVSNLRNTAAVADRVAAGCAGDTAAMHTFDAAVILEMASEYSCTHLEHAAMPEPSVSRPIWAVVQTPSRG